MAEETEKTSLKQLFQGMAGDGVEVLQGIVKSASPLKLQSGRTLPTFQGI